MLKVGLTGNVAAGKSSVARVWRALGAPVIDADELARRAVEPGSPAYREILETWGSEVVTEDGALDRAALRRIVFDDPDARARLEGIIHPAVGALRDQAYRSAEERGERLVVADIPLLFEVGLVDEFDVVVLVDAPAQLRLVRMVNDRGMDAEEASKVILAQMPSELKRARADIVIENTGPMEELERMAREAWDHLLARAAQKEQDG